MTTIGENAFGSCYNLTDITIPSSVTDIDRGAFAGTAVSHIALPEGLTAINDAVFSGCLSLKELTIPEGVTRIGDSAFSNCISLKSVEIPESVLWIDVEAFSLCDNLTLQLVAGSYAESYAQENNLRYVTK